MVEDHGDCFERDEPHEAATSLPRWLDRSIPRLRYVLIFALMYVAWANAYYAVNHLTTGRSVLEPMLPLEERIPRVTWLYPVYAMAYVQVLLPLWLASTRRQFWLIQTAFMIASAIAFACFILAPMAYPRPPLEVQGVFDRMLSWEYATDGSGNTFPSLHVCFAWTLWLGLRARSRAWSRGLLLGAVAISCSTVLVKQHFIVDVPAGALLAVASHRLAPRALRWLLLLRTDRRPP